MAVLLCGYYGEHNIGDDALLEVLLGQLPHGCMPLVTANDAAALAQRGIATVPRRSLPHVLKALRGCSALVLGGGSLLQDTTSFPSLLYYAALITAARLEGKPVLLWAQGLGPLRRRRSRALVRAVLPMVSAASWRDRGSAQLAQRWGCPGSVAPDPVWAFPSRPWHGRGGPIVVCWRAVPQLSGEQWLPYLQALGELAERHGREVIWLPLHRDQDRGLLERLSREGLMPADLAGRSREVLAERPEEVVAMAADAGLVVAMRLHGLILAAIAGAPCAALSYDPKVAAAADQLGCDCHGLAVPPPPPAELAARWAAALDRPAPAAVLEQLRQQAAEHRSVLARLEG
ncbi:polysaccharide pyruvyl transferase CsaB [Synechococcus sp. GFB01]|nr:polysaccharide pyruvyl transferase CsaB [Synechococcus sp. GFB01]KMM17114.1 polysaccharide pyruvyl transferase CsaB [Synechococcus sp. GFB01]